MASFLLFLRRYDMRFSGIGGQAVMEGVMMRNGRDYATAVRLPDGSIHVEKRQTAFDGTTINKIPLLRGIYSFAYSLYLGLSTLMYSSSFFEEEEEGISFLLCPCADVFPTSTGG